MLVSPRLHTNKTGEDITDKRFWIIDPDGVLYYDDWDLIRASSFAHYVVIQED